MMKHIGSYRWMLLIISNGLFLDQSLCSAFCPRGLCLWQPRSADAQHLLATSIQYRNIYDMGRQQRFSRGSRRIAQIPYSTTKRNRHIREKKLLISGLRLVRTDDDDNTLDKAKNDTVDKDLDDDGNYSDDSIDFVWRVGDVEADFQALEQAINFEDAEFNLRAAERVEMMDAFAQQRRLFLPDLHAIVTRPVRWSLIFLALQRILKLKAKANPLADFVVRHRLVTLPWDLHFWVVVVIAPILFLKLKKLTMAKPEPMPDVLKGLDPSYYEFVTTDWEDPETSCRDYVLCLAEQWVSAVKGMAWFGLLQFGCFVATRTSALSNFIRSTPYFPPVAVAILQLVTRIGAMVSIHQFPKLIFQLQRREQPCPKTGDVTTLQVLVTTMIRWGLPIGIASDLSQILLPMSKRGLVAFCGTAVAFLSLMELMYNESRKPAPPTDKPRKRDAWPRRLLHASQVILAFGAVNLAMVSVSTYFFMTAIAKKTVNLPRIPWMLLFSNAAILFAFIRPLCHLRAFAKIFNVVHMHDMSLATNVREVLSNPQEVERRYKWRYRLRWREPERIQSIVDEAQGNWFYWLLIEGSVEDKLERERIAELEKTSAQGRKLWDLARTDIEFNPFAPPPDRDLWKKDAMNNVARFHQNDYDKKSFTDPLGVAVQQRLGIGLRFMEDHTRRLKDGEKPSTRRLQARAAKSCVSRVNDLFRERNERTKEIVESVQDPQERQKQIDKIKDEVDQEVASMARRLSELIPTMADPKDGPGLKFQNYVPNSTIDAGGQKLKITLPTYRSYAVEALLRQYEGGNKHIPNREKGSKNDGDSTLTDAVEVIPLPNEKETRMNDDSSVDNADDASQSEENRDAFVESYLKQKFAGKKDDDDDDDDPDVVYV